MDNFHFILDESKFHFNNDTETIGMLCCVEVGNIFDTSKKLKEIYRELSFDTSFGELKNKYPHYTEDSHYQRTEIAKKISKLGFRAFIGIQVLDSKVDNSIDLYPILLKNLINPVIRNYKNDYSPSRMSFCFEQVEGLERTGLLELFPQSGKQSNIDVCVIAKSDHDGVSFIPDYFLGVIGELLKGNKNHTRSFADTMFTLLANRIVFIGFTNKDNKPQFFHFRKEGEKKFYDSIGGMFQKTDR